MPKFTLTYFNSQGRAEPIRLAFSIGKIEFEDVRLEYQQWGEFKDKTKFGQVPILDVDGRQFSQSRAILRYVGKLTGLYPQNYQQQLVVDEGMDLVEDMLQKIVYAVYLVTEEKEQLEAKKKLQEEILPTLFNYYEKQIQESKSGFYGEKLSVTDLWVYTIINQVSTGVIDNVQYNIDCHQSLAALRNTIAAIPEVQAFEAKHKN